MTVDVSQLNRLEVDLTTASIRVQVGSERVVRKTALDCEAIAKTFCPVDTGATVNSIGTDMETVTRAVVGPTTEYAPCLEFGTYKMAPRAFMGPAMDRVTPDFIAALEHLAGEGFR
jgi:HK97 gp10 family phage protein